MDFQLMDNLNMTAWKDYNGNIEIISPLEQFRFLLSITRCRLRNSADLAVVSIILISMR
jgi:hypothetical protein